MKKFIPFIVIVFFITLIFHCNNENKQLKQTKKSEEITESNNNEFVFLYYADSRGQPFSNWKQKMNEKDVKEMINNEKDNHSQIGNRRCMKNL
jgi:preprotein translocase subunit SecG